MVLITALCNLITCRWYKILKSHGFTIDGFQIDACTALKLYDKRFNVRYRSNPLSSMLDSLYSSDKKDKEYFLVCGYIEDIDLFVSLKYEVTQPVSKDCCICLHSLDEEFPVRIYGEHCFHDIHMNCLNDLRNKADFPCCCGRNKFASHTQITQICFSKASVNLFSESCLAWKDISSIPNTMTFPQNIIEYLCFQYPRFVKFCSMPYHNTVRSYHCKWLSKNKIKPI